MIEIDNVSKNEYAPFLNGVSGAERTAESNYIPIKAFSFLCVLFRVVLIGDGGGFH